MPNDAMEKKPLSKKSEIVEQNVSSYDTIHDRKRSITEINAKKHELEEKVKKYGPDLLTGVGMTSKSFLEKLNSKERYRRSKWRKTWEHIPFTEGLNKETLITGIQMQSKERIKQIRNFAKANPNAVEDIFGRDVDTLNEYLEIREENILLGSRTAIKASNLEDRRLSAEILAVEADRLQRLEWRFNHAGNLEDKGRETQDNIQKAYDHLKNTSTVDYRALTVIVDAVDESKGRTQLHLEEGIKGYKKLYKSWSKEANILINMVLKEDINFKTYNEVGRENKIGIFLELSKNLLQKDIENKYTNVGTPESKVNIHNAINDAVKAMRENITEIENLLSSM